MGFPDADRFRDFGSSMGLHRYYCANLVGEGRIELPEEEFHHAVRVRREAPGSRCMVFDGLGQVADGVFREIGKRSATLDVQNVRFAPRDLPGEVILGVSMPKGDRQRDVVEKACELGVHRLVPFVSERSVHVPDQGSVLKWQRYIVESCKQCERNRLMSIDNPQSFREWLEGWTLPTEEHEPADQIKRLSQLRLIAHPNRAEGDEIDSVLRMLSIAPASAGSIVIAVGPEGGFASHEIQLALDKGWQTLAMGDRILRVETAVCAAAVLAGLWIKRE
jgi:16S rRNA (uracil1498-N3)-methyltransferase